MSYFARMLGPDGYGTYHVDWTADGPHFERVSRPPEVLLVPGFVDIHIHGGFGIDFMQADRTEIEQWAQKLEACGYEAFLPTTITASLDAVKQAIAALPEDHPMIPGFHLEGPFLSRKYPGAQPQPFILDTVEDFEVWREVLEHPKLRLITMAPENPGALEQIEKLNLRGVIVSMGHTDATYDQARHGYEFGARHTTHTYNAMRGLHHREAGMLGYALSNPDLKSELIYDRVHVKREAAAILIRTKPEDALLAVSDGTMAVGMPPGQRIQMWGLDCVTGRGDVRLAENDALAGSSITLLDAFRNLADDFGEETAIRACCLNPRRALGMKGIPRVFLEFDRKRELVGRRVRAA